jgi:hypothetical protein
MEPAWAAVCVETSIEDSRFLSPLIQESDSSSPPAAEKTEEEVKITLEADRYETTNLRTILESLVARPNLSFASQTDMRRFGW